MLHNIEVMLDNCSLMCCTTINDLMLEYCTNYILTVLVKSCWSIVLYCVMYNNDLMLQCCIIFEVMLDNCSLMCCTTINDLMLQCCINYNSEVMLVNGSLLCCTIIMKLSLFM